MAGQTPQSEQVYSVYTEGQKADLTPHLGFDPAIGSPCKHGNNVGETIFFFLTDLNSPGSMLQINIQFTNYLPPPPQKKK